MKGGRKGEKERGGREGRKDGSSKEGGKEGREEKQGERGKEGREERVGNGDLKLGKPFYDYFPLLICVFRFCSNNVICAKEFSSMVILCVSINTGKSRLSGARRQRLSHPLPAQAFVWFQKQVTHEHTHTCAQRRAAGTQKPAGRLPMINLSSKKEDRLFHLGTMDFKGVAPLLLGMVSLNGSPGL